MLVLKLTGTPVRGAPPKLYTSAVTIAALTPSAGTTAGAIVMDSVAETKSTCTVPTTPFSAVTVMVAVPVCVELIVSCAWPF
jgi:hypothetical protein